MAEGVYIVPNQLWRIIEAAKLIHNHKAPSTMDLAHELECSKATTKRTVAALRYAFDMDIVFDDEIGYTIIYYGAFDPQWIDDL